MRDELKKLKTQLATQKTSIAEFQKKVKEHKTNIDTLLPYFDIHESELYKLGAVLRKQLNLQQVQKFSNGYAVAQNWEGEFFYIDTNGTPLNNETYQNAEQFIDERAVVQQDNTYHFIKRDGTKLNAEVYDRVEKFGNKNLLLVYQNNTHHLLKENGEPADDLTPDDLFKMKFVNRRAIVTMGNKSHFIKEDGTKLNNEEYSGARNFSNGLACVYQNGKYHFITNTGEKLNGKEYEEAESFSNGRALVQHEGKYHFIKEDGTRLNGEEYEEAKSFSNGQTRVKLNRRIHYIDINGERINSR